MDSKPLEIGLIKFIPVDATKGSTVIIPVKDGAYKCPSADGPVEGTYRVEIDRGLDKDLAKQSANPKAFTKHLQQNGAPVQEPPLSEKYNRQSILTVTVVSGGQNTFDFALENASSETTQR